MIRAAWWAAWGLAMCLCAPAWARDRAETAATEQCNDFALLCGMPDPSQRDARGFIECFRRWRTAKPGEQPPQ